MKEKNLLPNIGSSNTIIFGCIVGSQAYGTAVEGSDIDKKWIYVQSADDLFINGYKPQINISKDETAFELSRFIELAKKANPTVLEMLFIPEDCILYKDACFDKVLDLKKEFLTKQCKYSFAGYAVDQIEKAKSLDKKMNWEKEKTDRKSVLDFCYWITDSVDSRLGCKFQSFLIKDKFEMFEINRMGLSVIPHARDLYNLFHDKRYLMNGICRGESISNDVSLSDVKEDANCIGTLYFNKDAYTQHCKNHNDYLTWLKNRNTSRYVEIEAHGQKIDGKNLLHCVRLIETAVDIAKENDLKVRRPNVEYLKEIRQGKHNLQYVLDSARFSILNMKEAFEKSNLRDNFEMEDIMKMIIYQIRKQIETGQRRSVLNTAY